MKLQAVDSFAGFGGWSAGAKRTGVINVAHAINHDPEAIEWHAKNHPRTSHVLQDVSEARWEDLVNPRIREGILIASPSCQGFSEVGQPARRGTGGNGKVNLAELMHKHRRFRGTSMSVITAADVLRPRPIVVENVI